MHVKLINAWTIAYIFIYFGCLQESTATVSNEHVIPNSVFDMELIAGQHVPIHSSDSKIRKTKNDVFFHLVVVPPVAQVELLVARVHRDKLLLVDSPTAPSQTFDKQKKTE